MASVTLVRYNADAQIAKNYRELAELAPIIGQLIHELQKERGASTVFVCSKDINSADHALRHQKNNTDAAVEKFLTQIQHKANADGREGLKIAFDIALKSLSQLSSNRHEILNLSPTSPIILTPYTDTIRHLLDVISEMSQLSDNSLITKRFIAYESFMEAKEYTGQERAAGAIGFSSGGYGNDLYLEFISLIAKQEAALHIFEENASSESIAFAKNALSGDMITKHLSLRQIARKSINTGSTGQVSALDWFETATVRVDRMKQIEEHLISEFVILIRAVENKALQNFIVLLLGSLVVSSVILGGAYIIARSISQPLGEITASMHDIAEGNLEREIPHEDMNNAIGKMARALNTFKIKILENIELEKQAHKLRLKEEEELRLKLEIKHTKEIQRELRDSRDRAEIANKTKSEFLANMSHELRTPLNAIIGFSDIIKSGIIDADQIDRYREYAADINDSGIHLLDIINDILDLSKVEANKIHLSEDNVPLMEMIKPTLSILKHHIEKKRLRIITDEKTINTIQLKVDERRFKQILLNLFSNAIKFTNDEGSIEFKTTFCEDKGLTIEIKDNGIGIKPEDIPKALSPFSQIDSALNRQYEGTGLGLPLVKEFVELHDGIFELSSQFGVGTTVTIWLPIARVIIENPHPNDRDNIYPLGQRA